MENLGLKALKSISLVVGNNLLYTQGAGGNTSVKLNANKMAVKASGYLLKQVTEKDGFVVLDYQLMRDYLKHPDLDEATFYQKISNFKINSPDYPQLRPSMEAGFHALLNNVVIHTHSVLANILNCCVEGKSIINKLFPEACLVEYVNPGIPLILAIKKKLVEKQTAQVFFLENHGIIVTHENPESALEVHNVINEKISSYLKIDLKIDDSLGIIDVDLVKNRALFPDQVIYTMNENLLKSPGGHETLFAYGYILKNINKLGLTPKFISEKDVHSIINMESEKYRQKRALL